MNFTQQPLMLTGLHRFTPLAFVLLLGATISAHVPLALAQEGTDAPQKISQVPAATSTPSSDAPFQRLREGSHLVNQLGAFKPAGERIIFLAASGKGRYLCLENLNLERIGRLVRDNPENLQWEISGTVTEYGGANYLAVSRAVLRSKTRSRKEGN